MAMLLNYFECNHSVLLLWGFLMPLIKTDTKVVLSHHCAGDLQHHNVKICTLCESNGDRASEDLHEYSVGNPVRKSWDLYNYSIPSY